MQIVELRIAEGQVAIELSYHELAVIQQALNEICNGIPKASLSVRVIGLRDRGRALLERTDRILCGNPPSQFAVVFTGAELRVVRETLREVRKRIAEEEFATRMGAELEEVETLTEQSRAILVCLTRGNR